ncbi:MAG: hypothetical protein ACLPWF_23660 [Bryobacteraceae bacterium]
MVGFKVFDGERLSWSLILWPTLNRQGGNAVLTGKRFRLKFETVAIETHGDKRIAITIPSREVIEVMDPLPTDARMVEIRWNGGALAMFAEDVEGHGDEIKDRRVTA